MRTFDLLFIVALSGTAALPAPRPILVWNDEFDGPAGQVPDPSRWDFDLGGGGWGNKELEVYTKDPANAFLDGKGHLVIRAIRTPGGFTSARLKTQGKHEIQYGRIEARIRVPSGQGIWPAFWLLGVDLPSVGWPRCGEIDVLENIGREPERVHGTIHGPGYSGSSGLTSSYALPKGKRVSDDFHVFAIEWRPGSIRFYFDQSKYLEVNPAMLPSNSQWVFDHPFFIVMNVAVGGEWPGFPDSTSKFPQTMTVDWVRVWKLNT